MKVYYEDSDGEFAYDAEMSEVEKIIKQTLLGKSKKELIDLLLDLDFTPKGYENTYLEEECKEEIKDAFKDKAEAQHYEQKQYEDDPFDFYGVDANQF